MSRFSDKELKDFLYELYEESCSAEVLGDLMGMLLISRNCRREIENWYKLNKFIEKGGKDE